MDDLRLTTDGLIVEIDAGVQVGALRYCDPATIDGAVTRALGCSRLPGPGQVLAGGAGSDAETLLAWRSPTETLVLCPAGSSAALAALAATVEGAVDACVVDQTGGIWILRLQGPRIGELLRRLGATTAVPSLGACRIGRLAEITVASLCVREGEVLLLVERSYADHLLGWIRETFADF
jgi:heterotetrameric sarcosine oxidase gamma subunit